MATQTAPTTNNFTSEEAMKLLLLLKNYSDSNGAKDASGAPLASAGAFLTDRTQKTGDYTDLLAQALQDMYKNNNMGGGKVALPSAGGGSTAYNDAATRGDPSPELLRMLQQDRGNMLQQLLQANDLTTRQVDIGDYSVKGVKDAADRKFSALAPSVDRAAAIASSQGFGSALKRGVADSTQAVGMADDLTRQFSDVYSKLRQQADDSALADNAAMYQSYLAGKGGQVNQNQILANAANQLFSSSANVANTSQGNYINSAAGVSDRLLKALSGADSASVNNSQVSNQLFSPLLSALATLNGQGLNTAGNRFNATSTNAKDAVTQNGSNLANILGNPWVQKGVDAAGNWIINKVSGGTVDPMDGYNTNPTGGYGNWQMPSNASGTNWYNTDNWQMPNNDGTVNYNFDLEDQQF